jgi:hypothetical protein
MATNMRKSVTITNLSGNAERITLPHPQFEAEVSGSEDWTGTWLTGLYVGPRSGRIVRRTYSIWQARDGGVTGETYDEIDKDTYLRMCQVVGIEPKGPAPEL